MLYFHNKLKLDFCTGQINPEMLKDWYITVCKRLYEVEKMLLPAKKIFVSTDLVICITTVKMHTRPLAF